MTGVQSQSGDKSKTRPSFVPDGERVLIDDRPHVVFVVTQMWRWFVVGLLGWGAMRWVGMLIDEPALLSSILVSSANGALVIVGIRVMFGLVDRAARRHVLTDARIIAKFGILRTVTVDIPLRRVQHITMVRPPAERLFGIGSLGITSAGTGRVDLVWRGIEHPEQVLGMIRSQMDRVSGDEQGGKLGMQGIEGMQVTPVIGIVGGIGSGKSTVAQAFADLGCVVCDSDLSVRAIMREPAVINQLVEWWGRRVLVVGGADDGGIDRAKVAQIVFDQPFERRRLEGLIHPKVHEHRRAMVTQAIEDGAIGVIVDAPLLFEAGVDAQCDAVVYVDTPHEIRISRVQATRGWDAEELNKREKTQLGLEQKRKRSDYTVANAGLPEELKGRVARVLASIRKDLGQRAAGQ